MAPALIRPFVASDAAAVRDLFARVNRLLAPPHLVQAFEDYIDRSIREEIGRIADYYREKHGGFWVAVSDGRLVGMFGLEPSGPSSMEFACSISPRQLPGRRPARCWATWVPT